MITPVSVSLPMVRPERFWPSARLVNDGTGSKELRLDSRTTVALPVIVEVALNVSDPATRDMAPFPEMVLPVAIEVAPFELILRLAPWFVDVRFAFTFTAFADTVIAPAVAISLKRLTVWVDVPSEAVSPISNEPAWTAKFKDEAALKVEPKGKIRTPPEVDIVAFELSVESMKAEAVMLMFALDDTTKDPT